MACARTDGGMSRLPEMGSAGLKICAAVFYRPVLIIPRWSFVDPKDAG